MFGLLELTKYITFPFVVNAIVLLVLFINIFTPVFRREYFPRIDFYTDIKFKVDHGDHWVVEVIAIVRNVGKVRHRFEDFGFKVHGLKPDDALERGSKDIRGQTYFGADVWSGPWYDRSKPMAAMEPDTVQVYRHIAHIPKIYSAVIVHGHMRYKQKRGLDTVTHTSNRLVPVPQSMEEALRQSGPLMESGQYFETLNRFEELEKGLQS